MNGKRIDDNRDALAETWNERNFSLPDSDSAESLITT